MFNTIILQKGKTYLTSREYEKFEKGDTIWGTDRKTEELKRWGIEDEEEAKKELAKHRCSYARRNGNWDIKEYALEYCKCDEDGEFEEGSDFELALE